MKRTRWQRVARRVAEVARDLNTPKCAAQCGRSAVRETHRYGPVCNACYTTLSVIENGDRRRTTRRSRGKTR